MVEELRIQVPLRANELTKEDIHELIELATANKEELSVQWKGNRYFVHEIESFLYYVRTRPDLIDQIAINSQN